VGALSVVLTQPTSRTGPIVAALRERGIDPVQWPLIVTSPQPGLDWQALLSRLSALDWLVLPSPAAVGVVMTEAAARKLAWPPRCGLAVVGPGSEEALGRWRDRVPGLAAARLLRPQCEPFDADGLLAHPALARVPGARIAVFARADARDRWSAELQSRGASVETTVVYRARDAEPPADAAQWLEGRALLDEPTAFAVASAGAGRRLASWVGRLACARWALARPVLTVHPRIAGALSAAGWSVVRMHRPGVDGLLAELESIRREIP
jgi:uroporphyrinogen-III synthase